MSINCLLFAFAFGRWRCTIWVFISLGDVQYECFVYFWCVMMTTTIMTMIRPIIILMFRLITIIITITITMMIVISMIFFHLDLEDGFQLRLSVRPISQWTCLHQTQFQEQFTSYTGKDFFHGHDLKHLIFSLKRWINQKHLTTQGLSFPPVSFKAELNSLYSTVVQGFVRRTPYKLKLL